MIWHVTVEATHDDGTPYWGYSHQEAFVPTEDREADEARLAGMMLDRVKEAGVRIGAQAQIDLRPRA